MIGLIAVLVLAGLSSWGIYLCTKVTRHDRTVAGRCPRSRSTTMTSDEDREADLYNMALDPEAVGWRSSVAR